MGDRDLETGTMSERGTPLVPLDGDALRQANRRHPRANEITTVEDNGATADRDSLSNETTV